MTGKSKNLVGVQFMSLDVLKVFSMCSNPKEVVSNASEGMDLLGGKGK